MTPHDLALDPVTAAALVRFYADSGVDLALDDTPHDRLGEARAMLDRAPEKPAEPPRLAAVAPAAAVHADSAVQDAKRLAAAAPDLAALKAALSAFDGCLLKRTAPAP